MSSLSQDQGLFAIFDLKNDFPNEWYKAMQLPPTPNGREFLLNNLLDRLPVYTRGAQPDKVIAQDILVITKAGFADTALSIVQKTGSTNFTSAPQIGKLLNVFGVTGAGITFAGWDFTITDTTTPVDNIWLVVRYSVFF